MMAEMTPETLAATMEATWPAAASHIAGPWRIRDGKGGGQRVSATTAHSAWTPSDIALAEAEAARLAQRPLFLIHASDDALDTALAAAGYHIHDPVVAYSAPCASFDAPDPMDAFAHWPPLAIARDLWAEASIGPARLAVMHRALGPKTALLGRHKDRASGAAFVALHGDIAMLHALEVAPPMRHQGSARALVRAAAFWAADHGAATLSLVVTAANTPARALYASLGMQAVGQYHYRQK